MAFNTLITFFPVCGELLNTTVFSLILCPNSGMNPYFESLYIFLNNEYV